LITTTPRPTPLIRELISAKTTAVTRGSTYQNRANLPEAFFAQIIARYEGSRLGRQELNGEVLEDTPGALWTRERIEELRLANAPNAELLTRIVVSIDPSGGDTPEHDEQGIVVAALGSDGHAYVLFDASGHYTPEGWGKVVCGALESFGADRIVAETNYGGAMVESVLRTIKPSAPIRTVTASRGKFVRAEPVAALYEQGRVHHVGQYLELEDELCTWTPQSARSPNRLDALVWALTDLMIDSTSTKIATAQFASAAGKTLLGSTSRRW
jgi:phage terminase large subunit-like protein